MPVSIYVPKEMPKGLVDTSKDEQQPIDYFEPAVAQIQQPLEEAHVHLMAGRKLGTGGLCMPTVVDGPVLPSTTPTTATLGFSVHLEAYTKYAVMTLLYAYNGIIGGTIANATAKLTSDTDATGPTALELQRVNERTVQNAVMAQIVIQVGQGDAADMGAEEKLTLVLTNPTPSAGGTLVQIILYGADVQPLAPDIISV